MKIRLSERIRELNPSMASTFDELEQIEFKSREHMAGVIMARFGSTLLDEIQEVRE